MIKHVDFIYKCFENQLYSLFFLMIKLSHHWSMRVSCSHWLLCSFGAALLVFDSFLSFWWQLNVPDSFCSFFISEFILLLLHCNMVLFLQGALKHFNGELNLEMITQEFGVFITIWLSMFQFGFSGRAKKMCIIYICIYMCVCVYLKPMLILNI